MTEKLKKYNERQDNIEKGLFPEGEITLINISDNNGERKMMTLAYVIRQLIFNYTFECQKVYLAVRATPILAVKDWLADVVCCSDCERQCRDCDKECTDCEIERNQITNEMLYEIKNQDDFLSMISSADKYTTIVTDFDIEDLGKEFDYKEFLTAVRTKQLSLICTKDCTAEDLNFCGWHCGIVTFTETEMRVSVKPNFIKKTAMNVMPFTWCEYRNKGDGSMRFNELASLDFKEEDGKFFLEKKEEVKYFVKYRDNKLFFSVNDKIQPVEKIGIIYDKEKDALLKYGEATEVEKYYEAFADICEEEFSVKIALVVLDTTNLMWNDAEGIAHYMNDIIDFRLRVSERLFLSKTLKKHILYTKEKEVELNG